MTVQERYDVFRATITIGADGKRTTDYKNAYIDYGVPADEFVDVYTDHLYFEGSKPDGVLMP